MPSAASLTPRKSARPAPAPKTAGVRSSYPGSVREREASARPRGTARPDASWSDEALGALCATGSEAEANAAWSVLYPRMCGVLTVTARALRDDPDLVDDLVQETMLRAWDHRAVYDPALSYRSWVKTILHRMFTSVIRKEQVRNGTSEMGAASGGGKGVWHGTGEPDLEEMAEHNDLRQRLAPILDALRPEEREVLLEWAAGGSLQEFANARRRPGATVRSHLFRAQKKMRAHFESLYGGASVEAF